MSQRNLAYKLQLAGYDMDKNVITRIETNKRYVTDLELKAIAEIFQFHTYFSLMAKTNRSDKWGSSFRASPFYPSLLQIQ